MQHRPLALVFVLAGGDYLLWNWSLQGSHDVLALISGLTLPPLALALIWVLGLSVARGLAQMARAPRAAKARPRRPGARPASRSAAELPGSELLAVEQPGAERLEAETPPEGKLAHTDSPSSKLAA